MYVICCGMQRSGSTLLYNLASRLVVESGRGDAAGWVDRLPRAEIAARAGHGITVVKVHEPDQVEDLEGALASGEALCIYVYRDIRDVLVSLMDFRDQTFGQVAHSGRLRRILGSSEEWFRADLAVVFRYESFKDDLVTAAATLNARLGLELDDERLARIAEELGIDRQKQRLPSEGEGRWGHDPGTLLHPDHIRSGEHGRWRARLDPGEVAFVERVAGPWMRARGYDVTRGALPRELSRCLPVVYLVERSLTHLRRGTFAATARAWLTDRFLGGRG